MVINPVKWLELTIGMTYEQKGKYLEANMLESIKKRPLTLQEVEQIDPWLVDKLNLTIDGYSAEFKEDKKPKKKTEEIKIPMKVFGESFRPRWDSWLEYKRKEKGFKFKTEKSMLIAYDNLLTTSNMNVKNAINIINHSIANGYSGLFPPNSPSKTTVFKDNRNDGNW